MILIQPDDDRRVSILGVPTPVRRPVDVEQSMTGFKHLRTLRIYRFDQNSAIEGHAEEDEVYLVLLDGALELTITAPGNKVPPGPVKLLSTAATKEAMRAAYLPPGSSYRLVSLTKADVAYARATPASVRSPRFFLSRPKLISSNVDVLCESTAHAERLRFRLVQIDANAAAFEFSPIATDERNMEALLYLRENVPTGKVIASVGAWEQSVQLNSWETVAIAPGCHPTFSVPKGWVGLALIVLAEPPSS